MNLWDYSAKRVVESVYESMERLNIDYIDLISVHDIEFADLDLVCRETLRFGGVARKGVVHHVGITNLALRHFVYVIENVPPVRWRLFYLSVITR